jgi:hypothetical protein
MRYEYDRLEQISSFEELHEEIVYANQKIEQIYEYCTMSLADHEKRRQPQIYPQQYTYETYKTRWWLTRCFRDLFRDFCGCVLKASGRGDKWTTEHFTESMDDQQYFDQIVQMIDS